MEKLRPRGEVSSACQRPQSREQSPKGNPDSRRSPFRVLRARARLIQVAKRLGDSEPQGTHVTTLCSIRAAFRCQNSAWVGPLAPPLVSGSEQTQQSPLAEGRGRKEVAAEACGGGGPRGPSRTSGGGEAGPKYSGLLRNVSVHTQTTEPRM